MTAVMRKLWGINFTTFKSDTTADKESFTVVGPAISICGMSTAEQMWEALQSKDAANGFLNRLLIIEVKSRAAEREPRITLQEVPDDILQVCRALYTKTPMSDDMPVKAGKPWHGFKMTWGPGAQEIYKALSAEIDSETNPERRQLRDRVTDQAVRLATIRAGGDLRGTIEAADIAWGRDLALASSAMLCEGVDKYMTEELRHGALCRKILEKLEAGENGVAGEFSDYNLRRHLSRYISKGADFGGAITWLANCEKITCKMVKSRSGPDKSVWVLLKD